MLIDLEKIESGKYICIKTFDGSEYYGNFYRNDEYSIEINMDFSKKVLFKNCLEDKNYYGYEKIYFSIHKDFIEEVNIADETKSINYDVKKSLEEDNEE